MVDHVREEMVIENGLVGFERVGEVLDDGTKNEGLPKSAPLLIGVECQFAQSIDQLADR
jgi:hypothetical protein